MKVHTNALSSMQRRVLSDLVQGAVLIARYGGFEAYREVDGKIAPTGNRLTLQEGDALFICVPHLAPLRPEMDGQVWRLPADSRNAYLDALQESMPLDGLIAELDEPFAAPRMRSVA